MSSPELLQGAFNFTMADLDANRRGQPGPTQRQHGLQLHASPVQALPLRLALWLLWSAGIIITMVLLFVGLVVLMNTLNIPLNDPLAQGQVTFSLLCTGVMVAGATLVYALYMTLERIQVRMRTQLRLSQRESRRLDYAEIKRFEGEVSMPGNRMIMVGEHQFTATPAQQRVLVAGWRYAAYVDRTTGTILSIERIL